MGWFLIKHTKNFTFVTEFLFTLVQRPQWAKASSLLRIHKSQSQQNAAQQDKTPFYFLLYLQLYKTQYHIRTSTQLETEEKFIIF